MFRLVRLSGGSLALLAATAISWRALVALVAEPLRPISGSLTSVLLCGCAAALVAASVWLTLGLVLCWWDAVSGRASWGGRALRPRAAQIVIIVALGTGLVAGVGVPALADQIRPPSPTAHALDGLPAPSLPTVAPARWTAPRRSLPTAAETVTVQVGDSLWSIAENLLSSPAHKSASDAHLAAAWRAVYDANRTAIGDDPDLIHPGCTLTLPRDLSARPISGGRPSTREAR